MPRNRLDDVRNVSYDAAGNVISWNGNSYEYGPFNQMWHMVSGSQEYIHLYTADGERLWSYEVGPSQTNRWTIRDLGGNVLREYTFDRVNIIWRVDHDYIYRDGQLLASEGITGQHHYSLDHLGTPRLITNAGGFQTAYHAYLPFGEEATYFAQDSERLKFTGHERDLADLAGTGDDLDYMHARFCSPLLGRFLSVDRHPGHPQMPQSWNRYAYARGNPLKYVDPDGKDPVWATVALDTDVKALLNGSITEEEYSQRIKARGFGALFAAGGGFGVMAAAETFTLTSALLEGEGLLVLTSPEVNNPGLQKVVGDLFKATDRFVGGTANAIRVEFATGMPTAGRIHIQAGLQRLAFIQKLLKGGGLSGEDVSTAMRLSHDLGKALQPLLEKLGVTAPELLQELVSGQVKQVDLLKLMAK